MPLSFSANKLTIEEASKILSKKSQASYRLKNAKNKSKKALVPPPPAYMPNILPELYYQNVSQVEVAEESEDETNSDTESVTKKTTSSFAKYIYNRYENTPKPLQTRSGVSVWLPTTNSSKQAKNSF